MKSPSETAANAGFRARVRAVYRSANRPPISLAGIWLFALCDGAFAAFMFRSLPASLNYFFGGLVVLLFGFVGMARRKNQHRRT